MKTKNPLIIYKATNLINGKIYIGQTIRTLKDRINKHKSDAKVGKTYKFPRAYLKYGFNNFKFTILEICHTRAELDIKEAHYIKLFKSVEFGYNIRPGGNSSNITEEQKQKIREKLTGNVDWNKGEDNGMFIKLPESTIKEVIDLWNTGMSEEKISFKYTFSRKKVTNILKMYKNVYNIKSKEEVAKIREKNQIEKLKKCINTHGLHYGLVTLIATELECSRQHVTRLAKRNNILLH